MKYILSIDGGGIRGIIPALVLAEIEAMTEKKVSDLFDMVVGTSTGGILALGLCKKNSENQAEYSAEELVKIYEEHGGDIFSRSPWKRVTSLEGIADEKYSAKGLEKTLYKYFGDATLKESLKDVVITSYDIGNRTPLFFKSWREEYEEIEMRYVARATSAAPTYFEPTQVSVENQQRALVDGGVFINNPAVSAYVEAKKRFPNEEIKVLSIGTGELIRPIKYSEAKDWGKAEWVVPVMDCMFDGMSDAVNYQMEQLLGENYIRLQTQLTDASDDMDNATKGNIKLLKQIAEKLIADSQNELETIKNW